MIDGDKRDKWYELAIFQTHVAERWIERARYQPDPFARFFFLFSAFNALYFLWRKVDGLPNAPEVRHIGNLISKFSEEDANEILVSASEALTYFRERRPIQRMDDRSSRRVATGIQRVGKQARDSLGERDPKVRLNALGEILYLIRSNLVHGSKVDSGDDGEVIERSLLILEEISRRSLELTTADFSGTNSVVLCLRFQPERGPDN